MDWLTQNWVWIALAVGAVWLFGRGGMAGCGMGGHGGHGRHGGESGSGPSGGSPAGTGSMHGQGTAGGATPEKALDPVSGREVLAAHALTAAYQGRIYFFESPENRQRFEARPEEYAASAPAEQQGRHGCC